MRIKKMGLLLSSLVFITSMIEARSQLSEQKSAATPAENEGKKGHLYVKLETGASFSREAQIVASPSFWDPTPQGYHDNIGTAPILGIGMGCDFNALFSADLNLIYRPHYHYRKFQTSTVPIPGFLGNKTRRFDLDISHLIGMAYLNGRGFDCLRWKIGSPFLLLYPVIGGGVGVSQLKIYNFRSIGLSPVVPPYPAFASENQYTLRYRFTYQVQAGLELRYHEKWALSAGYRWLDIARFKGPRYFRDSAGNALDAGSRAWKIDMSANELFLALKLFL